MTLSIDEQIYRIPKGKLRSGSGVAYTDFKRGLRPRYAVVWRDIACGYLVLGGCSATLLLTQRFGLVGQLGATVAGALLFGFTLAYLNLFFHEAAHTNLAPSAAWNDRLADWFIGIFFGQSIQAYRLVHFGHHQHHGTPMDTEHSYFDPLNMRFILSGLSGVRAFQVARKREAVVETGDRLPRRVTRVALLRGLLLNGAILGGALLCGHWVLAVAWTVGVLSVFPFINALRQLLEHRDELAPAESDFAEVAHGRVNRLFGDGLLASTLGGAGFNRHLIHHWEPQVSYTRLRDLEKFVLECEFAPLFQQRQTTYLSTLWRLLWRRSE